MRPELHKNTQSEVLDYTQAFLYPVSQEKVDLKLFFFFVTESVVTNEGLMKLGPEVPEERG